MGIILPKSKPLIVKKEKLKSKEKSKYFRQKDYILAKNAILEMEKRNDFKFTSEPIIMDNEIISMPRINSEIPNGECYIDGFKTMREARHIKNQIK